LPVLDEAEAADIKVAVGSSSRNAPLVLEQLQLTERFEVIGTGNTVVNSKPAPDIFVWVAGALRLRPDEILVIEDSKAGVQAARAGGFYVLGIGNDSVREAQVVLPNLAEISLTDLFKRIAKI
jgi:HAD superfamily hydrolase (TIGR01509 family)